MTNTTFLPQISRFATNSNCYQNTHVLPSFADMFCFVFARTDAKSSYAIDCVFCCRNQFSPLPSRPLRFPRRPQQVRSVPRSFRHHRHTSIHTRAVPPDNGRVERTQCFRQFGGTINNNYYETDIVKNDLFFD